MGRVSQALQQVLNRYGISRDRLSLTWTMGQSEDNSWPCRFDLEAENVTEVMKALRQINPQAAKEFIQLYLGVAVSH